MYNEFDGDNGVSATESTGFANAGNWDDEEA
jgi:hypothetical protein